VPQAAIRFREPGWTGAVALDQRWQGLPPLPKSLVPIAVKKACTDGLSDEAIQIELLNPGPERQRWLLGQDWRACCKNTNVLMNAWDVSPGELITLVLDKNQSS
jgi:alpha-mannosidase